MYTLSLRAGVSLTRTIGVSDTKFNKIVCTQYINASLIILIH